MNATATIAPDSLSADMDHSAWMLMLRGLAALLFGVLALVWPDLTLIWLVAMFAVFALFTGGASIVAALKSRRVDRKWWLPLLLGVVSVVAGIAALVYPGLTTLALVLMMGANAIVTGALDIAIAMRLRRVLRGGWLMALSGIVSVLFGVLVFAFPGAGALAMVWLISFYALATGALLLGLGWQARRAAHEGHTPHPVPAGR
jgi:uncharacterized membrane protein HdeD (DUF308 family)